MISFPLPARFQAELYAVVVGLPGVRFDPSAADAAGRRGIGLYLIQDGFLKQEIIINPRTYTFMGLLWVVARAHDEGGRHLRKGLVRRMERHAPLRDRQEGRPVALTGAAWRDAGAHDLPLVARLGRAWQCSTSICEHAQVA